MRQRSTLRRCTRKFDSKMTLQDQKTSFHARECGCCDRVMQRLPTRVDRHFKLRCEHAGGRAMKENRSFMILWQFAREALCERENSESVRLVIIRFTSFPSWPLTR